MGKRKPKSLPHVITPPIRRAFDEGSPFGVVPIGCAECGERIVYARDAKGVPMMVHESQTEQAKEDA